MQVYRHQLLQHFFALHFASHNFWYSGVEYMYFVNHYKQHSEGRCSCQSHTRPWLHPAQEAFGLWTRVHDKRFVQSCLAIITGILYVELYWLACKQAKKLQDCPHLPQQKPFLLQLFVCIQQFFFGFARIRVYSTLRIKRWYKDGGPTEDWFAAAENGDERAVLRLLGSRPTLLKVKDGSDYCKPALHKAAFKNGHEESGWMLLKQVVVADTRDDNNCSLFTVLLIMVCRICIFYDVTSI